MVAPGSPRSSAGDPFDHAGPFSRAEEHAATGRVVRWDAGVDAGAIVVDGVPAEILVDPGVAAADLQPGSLVELRWRHDGRYHRAVSVRLAES